MLPWEKEDMKGRGAPFILTACVLLISASTVLAARTELISRAPNGSVGNGKSEDPSISDDARFVVYESTAKNLVNDKTTSNRDIFLYDRITRVTRRISAPPGEEADSSSFDAEISANGNIVVFASDAGNLVANDTQDHRDIFVYNRATQAISRVSVNSSGVTANGDSDKPGVSADGRYVVFQSVATNLVGSDTNNQTDIFRHDRTTGTTVRVSLDFLGKQVLDYPCEEPVISNDGRYIAFQTRADICPCDDNNATDIYLRDMAAGKTEQASVTYWGCSSNGNSYHPSISADGRFVSFSSSASDLLYFIDDDNHQDDVFLRDRTKEITERISVGNYGAESDDRSVGYGGNISSSGRYVAFSSKATTLGQDGNGGFDVFARDRTRKTTTREGVGTYWEEGSGDATANTAVISANGKYVVFDSSSSNLVSYDTNGNWDIFIRDYLWQGPLITAINPKSGDFKGGTILTITGSNFKSGAAVTIDGVPAYKVLVNAAGTTITCITPPHGVGSVEVKITNPDGSQWIYPIGKGNFNGYIYRSMNLPFLGVLLL
jgi:hypothetical protein